MIEKNYDIIAIEEKFKITDQEIEKLKLRIQELENQSKFRWLF